VGGEGSGDVLVLLVEEGSLGTPLWGHVEFAKVAWQSCTSGSQ